MAGQRVEREALAHEGGQAVDRPPTVYKGRLRSPLLSLMMAAGAATHAQQIVQTGPPPEIRALIDGFAWTAAYQVAEAYAFRGEVDAAFEWLERAHAQRDPGVTHSSSDVLLQPLHGDPRWAPFLRRMGFA